MIKITTADTMPPFRVQVLGYYRVPGEERQALILTGKKFRHEKPNGKGHHGK